MNKAMSLENVRIAKLEPMRVASYRAESRTPERDAWNGLIPWARENGILKVPGTRIFGFNNPSPSEGNPVYGYEFWITVGPDVEESDTIQIKEFSGGLYAVTSTTLSTIGQRWAQLTRWQKDSHYKSAKHQWLEEHVSSIDASEDTMVLDLYLPIAE